MSDVTLCCPEDAYWRKVWIGRRLLNTRIGSGSVPPGPHFVRRLEKPLSSEHGAFKTVKARIWPWRRLESGLGCQVKVFKTFELSPLRSEAVGGHCYFSEGVDGGPAVWASICTPFLGGDPS